MDTSLLIARILGPFYVAVALGIFMNRGYFERAIEGFEQSPALFYLSGTLAYAVGAVIIAVHNQWTGWPTVITLIGWAAILKGLMRTLAPTYSQAIVARAIASPNGIIATGIVSLVLGVYLTAMGFATTI